MGIAKHEREQCANFDGPGLSAGDIWSRSTRCESGQCVEVQIADSGDVRMRDGKDRQDVLSFSRPQWTEFIWALKHGELSGVPATTLRR